MNADDFRRIALSFKGSVENSHRHHPDFRWNGKSFATLGYPDAGWAMVRLTPSQQARFVGEHPECFQPAKGAWGRRGATTLNLFAATESLVRRSLALAFRNLKAAQHPRPRIHEDRPPALRASRKRAS